MHIVINLAFLPFGMRSGHCEHTANSSCHRADDAYGTHETIMHTDQKWVPVQSIVIIVRIEFER